MMEQLEHYVTAICGVLCVVLGWCWRLARLDKSREQRLERLEEWSSKHHSKHDKLDNIIARQDSEDRQLSHHVALLEQELKQQGEQLREQQQKRSERDNNIFARLDEMSRTQAKQGAQIAAIAETCAHTQQTLMDVLASRRPGGRRAYDQQEE